ncbi:MAG: methyltransferase, TIGR04325 family [Verrucomicrobia bacterium]|nr:methyltransferase, TIGR04325 family [Verrucomicrobiota bacterium]
MNSPLSRFAQAWLPPALVRSLRRAFTPPVFTGDFPTWEAARAAATGYEAPAILEKAVAATRAVRDGRAAYERDTVLFATPEWHAPLLGALLRRAAAGNGNLDVIDFGGALGSTWWQHRRWLEGLPRLRWTVVEQAHFVAAGRAEFETGPLRFQPTLDAAAPDARNSTLLLSSVLPYLENPHALLADAARRGFGAIIIDRTGFVAGGRDRLTLQRVPPSIYPASYPCWFFDRPRLLQPLLPAYRVTAEWPTFDVADIAAEFRGLLLERTSP